jgi:hypothetical protein
MKTILKAVGILVGIIIVTIVSFWTFYSYKSSDAYANKITQLAVDANDSSQCEKIMNPFGQDHELSCRNQVAIQNKNLNACLGEWPCLGAYFSHYKTSDPTLCKVIADESQRDECYFQQSYLVGEDLCALIRPNNKQSSCYINLVGRKKDGSICDRYMSGQQSKDICYERAASTVDVSWCLKIQDPVLKSRCTNVNKMLISEKFLFD